MAGRATQHGGNSYAASPQALHTFCRFCEDFVDGGADLFRQPARALVAGNARCASRRRGSAPALYGAVEEGMDVLRGGSRQGRK